MINPNQNRHDAVSQLVFELSKLPGIGEKTATRLAYHILKQDVDRARALSTAILNAKQKIRLCSCCFTFTDEESCRICSDSRRELTSLCVVEKPSDVFAIDGTGTHRGLYHVLHGVLSPLDGIGPEELKIRELLERVGKEDSKLEEIIIATNPSVEGEATTLYLTRLLRPFGVRITQLAHGLPVGGMLEYADKQTIGKALTNRMEIRA